MLLNTLIKQVRNPLIYASTAAFRRNGDRRMDFRWYTKHQFSGIGFLRRLPNFIARFNIIINRFLKSEPQFRHGLAVEPDHIPIARDMPYEAAILIAIFNAGGTPFILVEYSENDDELNGFIIDYLVKLKAV